MVLTSMCQNLPATIHSVDLTGSASLCAVRLSRAAEEAEEGLGVGDAQRWGQGISLSWGPAVRVSPEYPALQCFLLRSCLLSSTLVPLWSNALCYGTSAAQEGLHPSGPTTGCFSINRHPLPPLAEVVMRVLQAYALHIGTMLGGRTGSPACGAEGTVPSTSICHVPTGQPPCSEQPWS